MSLELLKMEGFKLIMMRDMYHNNIVASMSVYAAVTEEKAVEWNICANREKTLI